MGRVTLHFVLALLGIVFCVMFFVWLVAGAKGSQAQTLDPRVFLAWIWLQAPQPRVLPDLTVQKTLNDCLIEANRRNAIDPDRSTPENRRLGGEWVCIPVIRAAGV